MLKYRNLEKNYYFVASFFIMTAVVLGAFGAHALKKILEYQQLQTFETGVRYQMYMGLGLFGLALLKSIKPKLRTIIPFTLITIGTIIFSFDCYLYVMTQIKFFAMVIPIGGTLIIAGWLVFLFKIKNI
jgi:uncharacterized membrane protein YgdD (TMEM256/DUF423 family)